MSKLHAVNTVLTRRISQKYPLQPIQFMLGLKYQHLTPVSPEHLETVRFKIH